MLTAQKGGCAMCGLTCQTGCRPAVDHCHVSGRVRGPLTELTREFLQVRWPFR
ncbi:endonuclease domain-containing protein [Streptomyces sp. NPDC048254]|uniref:endonuclease domain-containing protein n=1 Tax=Streptomyces sp. NPDC048254 TaxID=3365525 RepID=UPI00371140ED